MPWKSHGNPWISWLQPQKRPCGPRSASICGATRRPGTHFIAVFVLARRRHTPMICTGCAQKCQEVVKCSSFEFSHSVSWMERAGLFRVVESTSCCVFFQGECSALVYGLLTEHELSQIPVVWNLNFLNQHGHRLWVSRCFQTVTWLRSVSLHFHFLH